ncbi:MAG: serine/threonine-protein kinase [Acidobacteriota bacterium]
MDAKRRRRIDDLLETPLAKAGDEGRTLRQALDQDPGLLRDLTTFVTHDESSTGSGGRVVTEATGSDRANGDLPPGQRIGPYRIERLLDRGGMGVVYLAVREDDFEQRVVLKLVHPGLQAVDILDRFYKERQILADLQHPNIARLLDGGSTADALPYFAMEYVKGVPIDRYCEDHRLSIRQRLELFRKVCAAVQFAHQSLVVHRDLKPGNILVTADGTPKLLDFGIAKILEPDLQSLATAPHSHPMTPSYASPEQFQGRPITTVSDVYPLGVLLYQLLSGHMPYRLGKRSFQEALELVCDREPPPPSAAVRLAAQDPEAAAPSVGRRRARALEGRLRGDLDAIVRKAMRKEPEHRYGSAAQLADDIRRYLDGLPVRARQGTWLYTAGKFARRHKLGLAAVAMIVAFAISTTVLWREAVREKTRAERVIGFLESLFTFANPDETQGETLTVFEILDRGKERILADLQEEPETRAEILGTLGTVHSKLGRYDEAIELKREALAVRSANDPRDRDELAKDINGLASLLYQIGDYAKAENHFREALAMRQRLGQGDFKQATNLYNLAATLVRRGRYDEAEPLHRQLLEIYRQEYGPESLEVARSLYSLGALAINRGDFVNAEPLLRQALKVRLAVHGPKHSEVAEVQNGLAQTLHARSRFDEALSVYRQALATRRQLLGPQHANVAQTEKKLAELFLDLGQLAEAEPLIIRAVETLRQTMPAQSFAVLDAESVLGAYLLARGRHTEAERYLPHSFAELRQIRGDAAPSTLNALERTIVLYESWGRGEDAARYRRIAEAIAARASGQQDG